MSRYQCCCTCKLMDLMSLSQTYSQNIHELLVFQLPSKFKPTMPFLKSHQPSHRAHAHSLQTMSKLRGGVKLTRLKLFVFCEIASQCTEPIEL